MNDIHSATSKVGAPAQGLPCLLTLFIKLKHKETGWNLGQVFNSRCGHACAHHTITLTIKTAKLKVENSKRTTFRLSLVSFRAPRWSVPTGWYVYGFHVFLFLSLVSPLNKLKNKSLLLKIHHLLVNFLSREKHQAGKPD